MLQTAWPNTAVLGYFNTSLWSVERSSSQKLNRETLKLNDIINQMDLTVSYRPFHLNNKEYTFFSTTYETFSKIGQTLEHKAV